MGELSLWGLLLGRSGHECADYGENIWGWAVYPFIMLYCFYILAQICDGHLTKALEYIVERLRMSEDVAGATFLAMASSAPELFCSIVATFVLVSASGVGNIVGSAVFNLLVIIGVVPVFAGKAVLHIWWYPTARDTFFYSIAILEVFIFMKDGKVYFIEALIMVISYCAYVFYFTQNAKIVARFNLKPPSAMMEEDAITEQDASLALDGRQTSAKSAGESGDGMPCADVVGAHQAGTGETQDPAVSSASALGRLSAFGQNDFSLRGKHRNGSASNSSRIFGSQMSTQNPNMSAVVPEPDKVVEPTQAKAQDIEEERASACGDEAKEAQEEEEPRFCKHEPIMIFLDAVMPDKPEYLYSLFILCCTWIGFFTYFAVDAAGRLGCLANMPDVVMGLVFLAAGTSVPDAMGSISVAKDGMGDMAVANAVGSNTFDILIGLGFPWMMKTAITQEPIEVPTESLQEAIIVLAVCLVLYLAIIIGNSWRLTKNIGFLLLALYVVVITWILVRHYTS